MLPSFIIIGAMKCGTSSLFRYLKIHPEIGMSEFKEVDYFIKENNYDKGVDWYSSQFNGEYKTFGEASPNYSKAHYFEGVPRRMHELLPDVKLIYLVRDPIDRIISHYTHNYSEGREHRNIKKVLQNLDDNHYVMCSRYYWQLEQFLEFYPRDQILVVPSYHLKNNRKVTLQQIFEFIGVDSSFYTPEYQTVVHKTNRKRRKGRIGSAILGSPFIRTLKGFIPDTVKDPIKRMTRRKVNKPRLSRSLRNELKDHLRPDTEKLRTFSGLPFPTWDV